MTDRKGTPAVNATRVVLLARAGEARERLSSALHEAGAELTLVADPVSADPRDIAAARPQAVLVALEPAVEDALERFDTVLSDPGVTVIFDEAELAAQRAGWDAARWVRHLAAKLNRHDDVLPPGWEAEGDWQPSPGPLPRREADALDIAVFAGEALQRAVDVPREDDLATVQLEDDIAGELALEAFDESGAVALEPDDGIAEVMLEKAGDDDIAVEPFAVEAADDGDGNTLELADVDALLASSASSPDEAVDSKPTVRSATHDIDLDVLEQRAPGLSLADVDSYGHGPTRGAVLVEGGLGGPDAVRQLLAGIPEGFPRPILIRLQLDGGRYDRLVKQMQRAARLPVALAEAGQRAEAGTIYFVPHGVSLAQERGQLLFVEDASGSQSMAGTLPANDSAVLLMSGSRVTSLDTLMAQASSGMLVAGQSVEGCYDAAASTALSERGGSTGTPAELAAQLAQRWPS